jgi:hypothetical protein
MLGEVQQIIVLAQRTFKKLQRRGRETKGKRKKQFCRMKSCFRSRRFIAVVDGNLKLCVSGMTLPQSASVSSRLMVYSKWEGRKETRLGRGGRVTQSRPVQSG